MRLPSRTAVALLIAAAGSAEVQIGAGGEQRLVDDCPGVKRLKAATLVPSKFKKEHMDAKQLQGTENALRVLPGEETSLTKVR